MDVAERLRELRKRRSLTLREVEEATGISKSTLSSYEKGERTPKYDPLEILADFYNVDMSYLTGKTEYTTNILNSTERELIDIAREVGVEQVLNYAKFLKGEMK